MSRAEAGRLKKSHTRSGLSIVEGYLFQAKLTDHNPLLEQGPATESCSGKRGQTQALH